MLLVFLLPEALLLIHARTLFSSLILVYGFTLVVPYPFCLLILISSILILTYRYYSKVLLTYSLLCSFVKHSRNI